MGIALYTDPKGNIYAITGRKTGPKGGTYLWQYLLSDSGKGFVEAKLVRKFGNYSGKKEIESIAVDNENGYVYYSDEQFGVRKYYADPAKGQPGTWRICSDRFYRKIMKEFPFYKTKTKKAIFWFLIRALISSISLAEKGKQTAENCKSPGQQKVMALIW